MNNTNTKFHTRIEREVRDAVISPDRRMKLTGTPFETVVPNLRYETYKIGSIDIFRTVDPETTKRKTGVALEGREMEFSQRTLSSFLSLIGQSPSVLDLFPCEEVVDRWKAVKSFQEMEVRVAIATGIDGVDQMLAITKPDKPVVAPDDLREVFQRVDCESAAYHDGVLVSRHPCPVTREIEVVGDTIACRTFMSTPLDGWGSPYGYTGALRLACLNGVMVVNKTERQSIKLGDSKKKKIEIVPHIARILSTYYNNDAANRLGQRLKKAAKTQASIEEYASFLETIESTKVMKAGRIHRKIGKADYDRLQIVHHKDLTPLRRQRIGMHGVSVYDIINAVTELATHHAQGAQAFQLNGLVGRMLMAQEFNLEGVLNMDSSYTPRALFFNEPDENTVAQN